MTFRAGICLIVLATLLSAPCAAPPASEPAPRPAVQDRIERLVASIAAVNRGEPDEGIPAKADGLQGVADGDRESLLLQLVLFLAKHPENEPTMGAALLIDFYQFTKAEKIAALVPYLDTDDGRLRDAMYQVLSTVDRPDGAGPDFAPYDAVLRDSENASAGLIRYLYEVSPIDALAATARAYAGDDAAARAVRRALQLERLRAGQDAGRTADSEQARREVDALSRDAAWWLRLYAAHLVRTDPDLGSPEIVERLRSDSHGLVQQALAG